MDRSNLRPTIATHGLYVFPHCGTYYPAWQIFNATQHSSVRGTALTIKASLVARILLVEGYTLYSNALALMLSASPELEVIAEFKRLDHPFFANVIPDLILIDLDTHEIDLGESLRLCRKYAPAAIIAVFTQSLMYELMQRCLALGVNAFLAKDMQPQDFIMALAQTAKGVHYIDPRVAGSLIRCQSLRSGQSPDIDLSIRELDVVRLITDGLTNKQISARLYLSEKTIKNCTSKISIKFGVTARAQIAVYALRSGII